MTPFSQPKSVGACDRLGTIMCLLFGRRAAVSAATHEGVAGSTAPERIRMGVSTEIGFDQSAGTVPAGQTSQAFRMVDAR